jgi:cystinosin
MFLISIYENDWSQFEGGNIPKLGLSVISICFDIVFMVQHYCLYRYPVGFNKLLKEKENNIQINNKYHSSMDTVI